VEEDENRVTKSKVDPRDKVYNFDKKKSKNIETRSSNLW